MVPIPIPVSEIQIKKFSIRYKVKRLALFGSVLRSDFTSGSDIDVLVVFQPEAKVGFLTLGKMQRELSKIFNHQVDLVPQSGLKPLIRQEVLDNDVPLVRRQVVRIMEEIGST